MLDVDSVHASYSGECWRKSAGSADAGPLADGGPVGSGAQDQQVYFFSGFIK